MIAVVYHCKMSGDGIPSRNKAMEIGREQMAALSESGLANAANRIIVGINGPFDPLTDSINVPDKSVVYLHGSKSRSELPTLAILREWIRGHSDWNVCYHHSKGVTQPDSEEKRNHRKVMEKAVIWNWQRCVHDLERGFDAVGVNLVDPVTRPVLPGRFFAGNFWWAKASYLLSLPPIPKTVQNWSDAQRCIAEMWIGRSKQRPAMLDYERPELAEWCINSVRVRQL